ncbi:BREX-2 system adenine-specific DNA-methyltransferase PglX [Dietzia natronolimnaea]|uniref:BREX-2 system adenine-specific DNA-methyltransferase PglX n=1 Tax=Dietzia natronolimnaea TaxID=161920 RepID=UPI003D0B7210
MIQSAALLKDLKAQLKLVQADLRARANDADDRWGARLQEEHAKARKRERTGHSWVVWRDNEVDQAAVAWLIAMTFVRFCEDNDLLSGARIDGQQVPVGWISGPGDRTTRAEENLTAYFRENPTHNRRDWIRQAFRVLAAQPAGKALVDETHNPVWIADISSERASGLIDFWRATHAGELVHDFSDPNLDTRFLGDLYQDLSDHARKTYALLQTPVLVEEFILDQTLTPALAEFGLDGIKLIDPTCGSGHFLLGAFDRLVDQWQIQAPALDAKERVRRAMDSIHGIDLNPFAVAIARFRLTVAGLLAMGERSLVGIPNLGFHLAIGDSLLGEFGGAPEALEYDGEEAETYFYSGEDLKEYTGILMPGQYQAVVGNPPYITVKDKSLNALYRLSYSTAVGRYALSAPFAELFFRLAIRGDKGQPAGYVGQITGNSFMKREFGKKLIEGLFAGNHIDNPVDLTAIVDSSGAWMPGHNFDGTPTVILFGRRRRAVSNRVRVVMGVKDDPGKTDNLSDSPVWSELVENLNQPGFDGTYVSVADLDRAALAKHPWSLSGGGAIQLFEQIEAAARGRLRSRLKSDVGFASFPGNYEPFFLGYSWSNRHTESRKFTRELMSGDVIRDWVVREGQTVLAPYDASHNAVKYDADSQWGRHLWGFRRALQATTGFGGEQNVDSWWLWYRWIRERYQTPLLITFAFVATHTHFVLHRGTRVFTHSAPILQVEDELSEDRHLEIVGLLNSSAACFWLKQVSQKKGGEADIPWMRTWEFSGTKVQNLPLPVALPLVRARVIDELSRELHKLLPNALIAGWLQGSTADLRQALIDGAQRMRKIRGKMIHLQEELDWEVYQLYGLIDEDFTYIDTDGLCLELGHRAFEISLARKSEAGEETAWFERHGSTPSTSVPASLPDSYRELVEARLKVIDENPAIRILERPEYKRRWAVTAWDDEVKSALESAILDRLDVEELWFDAQGPKACSVAELADALKGDAILWEQVAVLTGNLEAELTKLLSLLVPEEAVPYMAAHRYRAAGLEKFRTWQHVWDLQRREDAGEKVDIPVPPKYSTTDFRKSEYWKARGKLDVPKERFILYPALAREGDTTVVLGWAGWDHKDQALALAREFPVQDALGCGDGLLTQMVSGLVELEPWVKQWHSEMDVSFGVSPAEAISGVIDQQLGRLEATREEVTAWAPPAPTLGRRAKKS